MSGKRQAAEESCPVPVWIITFSDMTTNLLTFFVLLVSMGRMKDDTLFDQYEADGFLQMVKKGAGFHEKLDLGNEQIKYFINDADKGFKGRTIDARGENLRRIFKDITRSAAAVRSQIVANKTNFLVTDISFSQGDAQLNEQAKKFLTQFTINLQQDAGSREVKLYVLGLARDERTTKKQWILSARRAQAVADFLNDILPSQLQCPVYSWGAGPGGHWVTQDGPISRQSQILIAVLRVND